MITDLSIDELLNLDFVCGGQLTTESCKVGSKQLFICIFSRNRATLVIIYRHVPHCQMMPHKSLASKTIVFL